MSGLRWSGRLLDRFKEATREDEGRMPLTQSEPEHMAVVAAIRRAQDTSVVEEAEVAKEGVDP
jgi:hypothetical protein